MNFEVNVEVGDAPQTSGAFVQGIYYLHLAEGESRLLTLSGTKENLRNTLESLVEALDSLTDPGLVAQLERAAVS